MKKCFAGHLSHVRVNWHRLHWGQQEWSFRDEGALGQGASQGWIECVEDCFRPLSVPLWRPLWGFWRDPEASSAYHEGSQCRFLPDWTRPQPPALDNQGQSFWDRPYHHWYGHLSYPLNLNILSFLTGAGGESEYKKYDHNVRKNEAMGMELEYFNHHYGFSYFSISKTDITVKFVNADGITIYQYTRNKHWSTLKIQLVHNFLLWSKHVRIECL